MTDEAKQALIQMLKDNLSGWDVAAFDKTMDMNSFMEKVEPRVNANIPFIGVRTGRKAYRRQDTYGGVYLVDIDVQMIVAGMEQYGGVRRTDAYVDDVVKVLAFTDIVLTGQPPVRVLVQESDDLLLDKMIDAQIVRAQIVGIHLNN